MGDFSDARSNFTSTPDASQMSAENGTGDEELQYNISELRTDEMLSGHMSVKTNFPVLSAIILCL